MIIQHKCHVEIRIMTHRTSFDHIDLQNKTSPKAYDISGFNKHMHQDHIYQWHNIHVRFTKLTI